MSVMEQSTRPWIGLVGGALLLLVLVAQPFTQARGQAPRSSERLDVNDVSWLFPLPRAESDTEKLITVADLTSEGSAVWPAAAFQDLVGIAQSDASRVGERRITFAPAILDQQTWKVAGIRVDPSAPGGSREIRDQFGELPQIRLILQPVTVADRTVVVHDVAIHLIYSYITAREQAEPGVVGKSTPDREMFASIVADLVALKQLCLAAGVDTAGPLSVHPGLRREVPQLRERLLAFLAKHLHPARLSSMAVMGLHGGGPEPWVFLAMFRNPADGTFVVAPSPTLLPATADGSVPAAQMLSFIDTPRVAPRSFPMNLNRMSNDLRIGPDVRRGVSTAVFFAERDADILDAPAIAGIDSTGQPVTAEGLLNRDILDLVAHPGRAHFFNTDCVSCHTETTLRNRFQITPGTFERFEPADGVSGLDPEMSPRSRWNVRNFGWFGTSPTITQRTANETGEVVEVINREYLQAEQE